MYSKLPSSGGGGYLEATYGSYNRREVRGAESFAIVPDKLFVRLTGLAEASDGYVTRYDYQCFTGRLPLALDSPGSFAQGGTAGCKIGTDGGPNVTAFRVAIRYLATDHIEDNLAFQTNWANEQMAVS